MRAIAVLLLATCACSALKSPLMPFCDEPAPLRSDNRTLCERPAPLEPGEGLLGALDISVGALGVTLRACNNSIVHAAVDSASAALLRVCIRGFEKQTTCRTDDFGFNDRECLYVTRDCRCIQWMPFHVYTDQGRVSVTRREGGCAYFSHRLPEDQKAVRVYRTVVTFDWRLTPIGITPSAYALHHAKTVSGLNTSLTKACRAASDYMTCYERDSGCSVKTSIRLIRWDYRL